MIMLAEMHKFSGCGMQPLQRRSMMMRHCMQSLSRSLVHTGACQTREDVPYGTPKQLAPPRQKIGRAPKGDARPANPSPKAKATKRVSQPPMRTLRQQHLLLRHMLPRKPRLVLQAWKDSSMALKRTSLEWFLCAIG